MLLAVVVPFLVSHIKFVKIPIVVGEIIAGIIIGQSGFNLVEETPTLNFLSEFGFAFLMFLSGLEVNFDALRKSRAEETVSKWKKPIPLAFLYFFSTVALAFAFGYGFASFGLVKSPLLMGLILSTTSLGIVVPILKERGLAVTNYGQSVLVAALVSDFVTLLLLSVVIAVLSQGFNLELLLFMVLIVAFVVAVKISKRLKNIPGLGVLIAELSHATAQIRVRGAFALLVTFVVVAESLGVELILGAFLGGVLVSISSQGTESPLHSKLDAIGYGFFIPIFFIVVGAKFDLKSLLDSPTALLLVPVLIFAAYFVKLLPALFYKTVFSWRETLALGTLLSSRLSLIIAASAIALSLGLISTAANSAVILVAIVTCTVSPLLFSWILPEKKKIERSGIVIFGTHQLARLLAQRLGTSGEKIVFMSRDAEGLKRVRESGFEAILWNPADEDSLEQANLSTARAFLAVSNLTDIIPEVCRLAKERFEIPTIIARADEPEIVRQLKELNVGIVQSPLAVALAFESALLYPSTFDILVDKKDDVELADIVLGNRKFNRQSLRQIRLPGNALIIGIRRAGETIIPHGDTVVRAGDTLILIGSPDALRDAHFLFGVN